jgi:hypothetical protein
MTTRENQPTEAEKIWQQLDAEAAGTAQAPVEQAPAVEVPAQTANPQEAAPAATAADATPATPSASQEWQDKLAGLETMVTSLQGRLRNAEGHIGSLNGQLKQQLAAAQTATAKGAEAPSAEQLRQAQGSAAAMESLKKDYPEFADALTSVLDETRKEVAAQLAAAPKEKSGANSQPGVTQADLEAMRTDFAIEQSHPGWKSRVKTPEFAGWLQRQPIEVRMLANSEDPAAAVRLLDLHKDGARAVPNKPNASLEAAAAIPTGRSGSAPRLKTVDEMTDKREIWGYYDSQERASAQR